MTWDRISAAVSERLSERDDVEDERSLPEPTRTVEDLDRPSWSDRRVDEANRSNTLRSAYSRAMAGAEKREVVQPSAPPVADPDASLRDELKNALPWANAPLKSNRGSQPQRRSCRRSRRPVATASREATSRLYEQLCRARRAQAQRSSARLEVASSAYATLTPGVGRER